jgi:serine/threonine protein phosphatase PrpC
VTTLVAAWESDVGRVRSTNQDCALVDGNLLAVADGMGGHAAGEVAARVAVDALRAAFDGRRGLAGLVAATEQANREILERSAAVANLRGMGTTLTAAAIVPSPHGDRIAVVNVGDSRAYLFEHGRLRRLTEDHSVVEEMLRQGELTPAQAAAHPHRHILTRALGIDPDVEVDSWLVDARPPSRLLLCSDGLTNECSEDEIAQVLATTRDPAATAHELVRRALEHGGSDNVTVVVADVVADGGPGRDPARTATRRPPAAGASAPELPGSPAGVGPTGPVPELRGARRAGGRRRNAGERLVTARVVLFLLLLAGVLGGAAGFVVWFDRATYFVGLRGDRVAIFEGRPGGLLWMRPTVVEETSLTAAQVFPPTLPLLRAGILESSFGTARQVVANLAARRFLAPAPGSATAAPASAAPTSTGGSTVGRTR